MKIEIPRPIFKIKPRGIIMYEYRERRYFFRWIDVGGKWCFRFEVS